MAFLYPLIIVVHLLICAALIIVVLLQSSKGEGLAGAFGGGGLSGAVFGGRGAATFLSKATTVLAICFMITSIGLTILSLGVKGGGPASGVIENLKTGQSQQLPSTPSAVPGIPQQGEEQPGPENGAGSNLFNQPPAQNEQPSGQTPSTTPAQTPPSSNSGTGK